MDTNEGESVSQDQRPKTADPPGRTHFPQRRRRDKQPAWKRRRAITPVPAAILLTTLLLTLQQEALSPWLVILGLAALAALAVCLGRRGLRYCLLAGIQVALVFTYSWTLSQSVTVVVTVSPHGLSANIGGVTRNISLPLIRGSHSLHQTWSAPPRIGFYSGAASEYAQSSLGVVDPSGLAPPVKGLVNLMRFMTPMSAWSGIRVATTQGRIQSTRQVSHLVPVTGSVTTNQRGEVSPSQGSVALLPNTHACRYTLSANLNRPDGLVGILVGTHVPTGGYILAIRMDERQAWWAAWQGPHFGRWTHPPVSNPFPLNDLTGEIQFFLRTLLPSLILATGLALLALLAYSALSLLLIPFKPVRKRIGGGRRLKLQLPSERLALVAAVLIALGAVGIMAWLSGYGYERIPSTQDTVVDLFQGKTLALGRLWAPVPDHLWFFGQYSTLDLHHHWFGKYPPGWAAALAVGVLFGASWMANPVASGIGVLLVFLIGKELFGWKVGLVAEILALSSPFILFLGAGYYAEPITWTFTGLYVYLLLRWRRAALLTPSKNSGWRTGYGYLIGAGLAIGMSACTRPLDALVFGLPFLLILVRRPLAVAWLAPGAAIPVGLYVAYSVILTGSWIPNGHQLVDKWDTLGFGPDVGGPPHSYFSNFTPNISFSNLAVELENFHVGVFGWPFFIAIALCAVPFILGRTSWKEWMIAAAGIGIMLGYWFYWGTAIIQSSFPRYWYSLTPCAALLAARGFQELYRLPLAFPKLRRDWVAAAIGPAALLVGLLTFNATFFVPALAAKVHSWNSENTAPLDAVSRAGIHHAIVFQVEGSGNWWVYGCVFDANSPLLNTDIIWAQDKGWWDRQLMAQYPHRVYYRLNNITLTRIYPKTVESRFKRLPTFIGHQECASVFSTSSLKRHRPSGGLRSPLPI